MPKRNLKGMIQRGAMAITMPFMLTGHTMGATKTNTKSGATFATIVDKTNADRIQIKTLQDLENLFNKSKKIIFPELELEEVPMSRAYDDGARYRGGVNTLGAGSTFAPKNLDDYMKPDALWLAVRLNQKIFANRTYSYPDMAKMVIGWGHRTKTQHRETGKTISHASVLQRMYDQLRGAALRPNEFAALYCAVYNNESNILKLCPFIRKNYNDPIKCANQIMNWYKNVAHNTGTISRCIFESLVYLNANNFCNSMLNMQVSSKGYSCINITSVKPQRLTRENYLAYSNACKSKYLKFMYDKTHRIVISATLADLQDLLGGDLLMPTVNLNTFTKDYDAATKLYQQGKYSQALRKFLALEKSGVDGCDLMNDIAISYFKLDDYKNCIKYSRKILTYGQRDEYAKAVFNAGLAYEKMGKYDNAVKNFTKALEYFKQYGIADMDSSTNYAKIYANAIKRAKMAGGTKRVIRTPLSKQAFSQPRTRPR